MSEPTMWGHRCQDGAGMVIVKGEACSWCEGTEAMEILALEEAAKLCEEVRGTAGAGLHLAAAIRALAKG